MSMYFARLIGIVLILVGATEPGRSAPSENHLRVVKGIFALQGGREILSARAVASLAGGTIALDITEYAPRRRSPIRDYDTDMTKKMHLIVVTADLRTFDHLHPTLGRDGHFRIRLALRPNVQYEIYADAVPHGVARQVFRFPFEFDRSAAHADPPAGERASNVATVGPYRVRISPDTLSLDSRRIAVHIEKGGRPANDLHPYLGTFAHAVFIRYADLSYAHVHPMATGTSMATMPASGAMSMPMPAMSERAESHFDLDPHLQLAGLYRLWIQFDGGGRIYAAPFIVAVR